MWKYILQRIILIFITAFIILSLSFMLLKLVPGDNPIGTYEAQKAYYEQQVILGYYYRVNDGVGVTSDYAVTVNNVVYRYNQYSIIHQYWVWLSAVLTRFDWGLSSHIQNGSSAISIITSKIGVSMKLNILSMIFSIPLGFIFGITSALKKNSVYDNVVQTVVMVAVSVPSFVLISFLILWLSFGWKVLPSFFPGPTEPIANQIKGYVIPVLCLTFGTIAGFTRYIRAELTEVMSSEFLLLARTKGLTKAQTVLRHALRNSMVPIFPMIIGEFIGILGGSMILEQIYAIPGIGYLYVTAINAKDYNVVMTDMACYTLIGLFATLLVDLSYGIIDPRIRMGARK